MATVLYITAHPHDESRSYSLAVGNAFKEAYREANPGDEVVHLDLYRMDIPQIDEDVFSGWGKLASGRQFDELSEQEKRKVGQLGKLVDQFLTGDKYVFVSPMWNLASPPILKAYFDSVCVAGKTFKYTAEGAVGLLGGRKVLHIQGCGGVYSDGPGADFEMGHRYLKTIMNFLGATDVNKLFVEGMAATPDKADQIKADAIARARELAKQF